MAWGPLVQLIHLIGEDGVGLDELLGESVREPLEDVAAHAGPGAAGDRVRQHEALERVGALGLAVDDVEDLLVELAALIEEQKVEFWSV